METQQIVNYFRASLPVVAVESPSPEEYSILEDIAVNVANILDMNMFAWNLADGLKQIKYSPEHGISFEDVDDYQIESDPILDSLCYIENYNSKAIFVMIDLQYYIGSDVNRTDYSIIRKIKNLCFSLKRSYKRMILVGQGIQLSSEFDGLIHLITNNLPTQEKIKEVIQECFDDFQTNDFTIGINLDNEIGERLIRTSQGLTVEEIRDALRISLIADDGIKETCINRIRDLKISKLQKLNVEFSEAPDVEVGGLDNLKQWINQRSKLFSAQVSNIKLPSPKGMMLVGVAGCGKSLVAKTIGQIWSIPILKLDMSSIYNSLVGESEKNMKQILSTAEAVAPCVLWIDEIEKALAGTSGNGDSGVSSRIFGQFLTWMNDHKAPVFVVATANDISSLPPELSRKGRFDEVFFVDLPNISERTEILKVHLNRHDVNLPQRELAELAQLTENFSGAEIAGVVDDGAITSFDDDRYPEITVSDLIDAIKSTVPLAVREKEKIGKLKAWANTSARFATSQPQEKTKNKTEKKGSKQVQMI